MTNLDIIKHLAANNPTRLAELLDDIYCCAWNCGSYAGSNGEGKILEECEIDDFEEWVKQDAAESGFFFDYELEEWSKENTKMVRNCLNCAHLGDPIIWCDACDDFEYWEEEK